MRTTAATVAVSSALALLGSAAPCSAFSASSMKMALKSSAGGSGASVPDGRRAFLARAASAAAAAAASSSSVALPGPALAADPYDLPSTGTRAPNFDLPNSRGEGTTSLADLTRTGKWTVLYFYPGAFTKGCTLEAKGFQRDKVQYQSLNAQIVGVSVDPVEKNAAFCDKEGLDFYMLSDRGGIVSRAYGSALSVPGFGTFSNRQTYLIDPRGNLRWVFTDVESHVVRHSAEVLEKLGELVKA